MTEKEFTERLGLKIKLRRKKLGLTQAMLAAGANITQSLISKIERGETGAGAFHILNICDILKISPSIHNILKFRSDRNRPELAKTRPI